MYNECPRVLFDIDHYGLHSQWLDENPDTKSGYLDFLSNVHHLTTIRFSVSKYKQIHNLNPVYIKYMNLLNLFLFFIVF